MHFCEQFRREDVITYTAGDLFLARGLISKTLLLNSTMKFVKNPVSYVLIYS